MRRNVNPDSVQMVVHVKELIRQVQRLDQALDDSTGHLANILEEVKELSKHQAKMNTLLTGIQAQKRMERMTLDQTLNPVKIKKRKHSPVKADSDDEIEEVKNEPCKG